MSTTLKRMREPTPDHTSVVTTALIWAHDLGDEVVVGDLAGRVVHDAGAAERRIHQDAGPDRADDAADAVHAEHVERVVVAERVLHRGAEEQADRAGDEAEHERAHRSRIAGGRGDGHQAGDAPDSAPSSEGLPFYIHSANIHDSAAAAVATKVLVIASAAPPLASRFEPALKPNQPTHSSAAPTIDSVSECGAMISLP